MTFSQVALAVLMLCVYIQAKQIRKMEMSVEDRDTNFPENSLGVVDQSEDLDTTYPCDKGFKLLRDASHRKWCVFVGRNRVTWYEALQLCKCVLNGGSLVELHDEIFAKHVGKLIYLSQLEGGFWVGGTNLLENSTFVWTESKVPIDSSMWDAHEPSYTNHAEYCAELRTNGKLNDNDCHAWMFYVCGKCVS